MSGERLEWAVHPFAERRGLGIVVLVAIFALSVLAALWGGGPFWGIFAFAILFLSLESFYFPTRYLLDEEKLTVVKRFSRSERQWSVFRRCCEDADGITLSPFSKSNLLEPYRAIRVRFGPVDRAQVTGMVRGRLGEGAQWVQDPRWRRGSSAA